MTKDIPLSCPEIRFVQSRLLRIRDFVEAEELDDRLRIWTLEADEALETLREINRALRKAAS